MPTAQERKRAESIATKLDEAVGATGESNPKKRIKPELTLTLGQWDYVIAVMRQIATGNE